MGPRRLIAAFCFLAVLLGAVQAWTARRQMNPDGIQYLDNADAYWRGDLHTAINTQWSPLYPWLIGAGFKVSQAPRMAQFEAVHALNFGIYLASLAAFLFFLSCCSIVRLGEMSRLVFSLIACSAFLYCSLDLTSLALVTPDLLVNAFAFLAAGLLLRIANGAGTAQYSALGVVLGLGYLAKTPFFVYAVLCLVLLWIVGRRRVWLTALMFASLASPYAALLSSAKGRMTIGDSGRFNLIWMVNGLLYRNWQGGPPENGRPIHPTRQLSATPAVFEFDGPISATYPPWYDPIYWNEGARVAWRGADFGRAFLREARLYGYLIYHRQVPLLFAVFVFALLVPRGRELLGAFNGLWPAVAFALAPFAMYAFVHAEGRYLAPFFVLLWSLLTLGVLSAMRIADANVPLAVAAVASGLMLIAALHSACPSQPIRSAHEAQQEPISGDDAQFQIARDLTSLGLKTGDSVAILDGDLPYSWARLAGARITMEAEVTSSGEWRRALGIFEERRPSFLVAPHLEGVVDQPGWMRLQNTGAYVYRMCPRN